MTKAIEIDWYERRDELQSGQVFKNYEDRIVMLDRRVPGDGTKWYVANRTGKGWSYEDDTIEPSDLTERLDGFAA